VKTPTLKKNNTFCGPLCVFCENDVPLPEIEPGYWVCPECNKDYCDSEYMDKLKKKKQEEIIYGE
jgi:ribosomal protein L37AE/L43A